MVVPDETIKSCEDLLSLYDLRVKYQSKHQKLTEWSMPEDPFAARTDLKAEVRAL